MLIVGCERVVAFKTGMIIICEYMSRHCVVWSQAKPGIKVYLLYGTLKLLCYFEPSSLGVAAQ